MSFLFNTSQAPLCIQSAFQGTLIKIDPYYLHIKTEIGTLKMHFNSSISIFQWQKKSSQPLQVEKMNPSSLSQNFKNHKVSGLMGVYLSDTFDNGSRFLCMELFLHGKEEELPYNRPDFWKCSVCNLGQWWRDFAIDKKDGGYYAHLHRHGELSHVFDGTDKWGYMIGRMIYTFSSAFLLSGKKSFYPLLK